MQHGDDDVQRTLRAHPTRLRVVVGTLDRDEAVAGGVAGHGDGGRLAALNGVSHRCALEQRLRVYPGQPVALVGDANRHDLVFVLIERLQHRGRRGYRDLMLARAPAKDDPNPQLLAHVSLSLFKIVTGPDLTPYPPLPQGEGGPERYPAILPL